MCRGSTSLDLLDYGTRFVPFAFEKYLEVGGKIILIQRRVGKHNLVCVFFFLCTYRNMMWRLHMEESIAR